MVTAAHVLPESSRLALSRVDLRPVLLFLLLSALLLVPCFWHRHIEAGDLGSHVYNAWLAQLIEQGKAPGLYTVPQWNNVLFDILLLNFAKMFGFLIAEKLATSLLVLVFFWGVFLLMRAISGHAPWFFTPLIAMLAYGHLFHNGFLNYYGSVGLACIGLSLLWPATRNGLIASVILAPVILIAHPLGFALFLAVGAYRMLWRSIPRWNWILALLSIAVCAAGCWYLSHRTNFDVEWREVPVWRMTGVDQFHVFGTRYVFCTRAVLLLAVLSTILALLQSGRVSQFWRERRLAGELYLVSFCIVAMLPENVHTDPTAGWVGEIATRLTLVVAVFGLCWIGCLPPRRWHLAAYSGIALVFFLFIYGDTAFLNRMEASAEEVTGKLPFGTRAVTTMHLPADYRAHFVHIVDRACIGHCFLVSNYEPSTRQFRIRVREDSPVAVATVDDSEDMQAGNYVVQPEDLPLEQIYQCDARDLTRICIHDLAANEKNGAINFPQFNPSPSNNDAQDQ
jgi:hypothetical protein